MNECTHKKEGKQCPYEKEAEIGTFLSDRVPEQHYFSEMIKAYTQEEEGKSDYFNWSFKDLFFRAYI